MQTTQYPRLSARLGRVARAAVAGATAIAAAALMGAPAFADEISDLKAQLQALANRIAQLEAKQGDASAPPKAVSSGNENVGLEVSGQVNRMVLYVDDGDRNRVFNADNDNSSTRIRFVGKGRFDEDVTAGALVEVQFESNTSASLDIDQDGEAGVNNFNERHLTVWLDSKRLGRLWLGQGDTASNGTSEVDLSGTSVIAYAGIEDLAGGISFKNAAKTKLVRINQAYSQFDGLSRRDRIRYDTPTFSGFKASTSFSDGDAWDAALRYSAAYPSIDTKVAAAVAYASGAQRFDLNQINGSISALHGSGLSLTFAAGEQDLDGRPGTSDPFFGYLKLGYQFASSDIGKTYLSADYGLTDDLAAQGDDFDTWGLFAVQKVDKIATELYFGYRNHSLDRTGVSIDDINVVAAGARLKF